MMPEARVTTCLLCDVRLIAKATMTGISLCPQCKGDLQWKVNRAVQQTELDLMRRIQASDPFPVRARRWLQKHSVALQGTALFFFTLALGILVYGWVLR